jgi:cbb3-type cytochrome c oxidase subunit III
MRFLASLLPKVLIVAAGLVFATIPLQAGPALDAGNLFHQKCAMCHGKDGKGFSAIKTPDFTDPKWQASIKDKQIEEVIKDGKKGTAMPAFEGKLKEDEMRALIQYIRTFSGSKGK